MCTPEGVRVDSEQKVAHRLSADMPDDVVRMVDVHSVKVDTHERARVRDAIEDRCHAATWTAPVCPEIDDGDAVGVDLYSKRRDKTAEERTRVGRVRRKIASLRWC